MAVELEKLIADMKEALGCPYVSPGTTDWSRIGSGVDCSGLLAAAFRHQGESLPHGSNAIARGCTSGMTPLTKAGQLFIGAAVFKWKPEGAPKKYTDGLGNWHHIGLVVSTSPLRIIHASSVKGRVVEDAAIRGWTHVAALTKLRQENEMKGEMIMTDGMLLEITARPSLLIRSAASRHAAVQGRLKYGARVEADRKEDGWYRLKDGSGWICGDYVKVLQGEGAEETAAADMEERVSSL